MRKAVSILRLVILICAGAVWRGLAAEPPLTQINSNVFQLGPVRLDKAARTIQFPARFNMSEGLVEYFLVSTKGKTYESLLNTEVEPYSIHLAMLLLGAKGAPQTPALLHAPAEPFHVNRPRGSTNGPPEIAGDAFAIQLSWQSHGVNRTVPAEECLINVDTKTNAAPGAWIYNGSRVLGGTFIAQREGSIVAMIDDIDAMANNPRPGHDNDQIWQINTNLVPSTNTLVQVTFKLETPVKK